MTTDLSIKDALLIINGRADELDAEGNPSLAAAIKALDQQLADSPDGLSSKMKHYLERRSYQKALAHIEAHAGRLL